MNRVEDPKQSTPDLHLTTPIAQGSQQHQLLDLAARETESSNPHSCHGGWKLNVGM